MLMECGGGGGVAVYSTSEKQVGTWVDGKNIYRKVVSGTTITAHNYAVSHGITFDEITDCTIIVHTSLGETRTLNFVYRDNTTVEEWFGGYYIDSTKIHFQIGSTFAHYIDKWHAIIEYTK